MSRHPGTEHLLRTLRPNPKLDDISHDIAKAVHNTALVMCEFLEDGPELTAGLRKLREAKDCFVLQHLEDAGKLKDLAQHSGLWKSDEVRVGGYPSVTMSEVSSVDSSVENRCLLQ